MASPLPASLPFHPQHENNLYLGKLDPDNPKAWSPRKLEEWKNKYNTLRYKVETGPDARPYDCRWCGSKHEDLKGLVVHVNGKHARLGDKEYWKRGHRCEWEGCSQEKNYQEDVGMMVHLRLHTGERPYLCPHDGCTLQFSTRESNLSHQRPTHRTILRPIFIDVRKIGVEDGDSHPSSSLEEDIEEPAGSAAKSSESGDEGGAEDDSDSGSESESEHELRRSARVPKAPRESYVPSPGVKRTTKQPKIKQVGLGPDVTLDPFVSGSESESVLSEGVVLGPRGGKPYVKKTGKAAPVAPAESKDPKRRLAAAAPERPSSAQSRSARRTDSFEQLPEPVRKRPKLDNFEWQKTIAAPLPGSEKLRRVTRTFTGQKKKLQKYRAYLDRCRMDLYEVSARCDYLQSAHPDPEAFTKVREGREKMIATLDILVARCDSAILSLDGIVLPRLKKMADEEKKEPGPPKDGAVQGSSQRPALPVEPSQRGDESEDGEGGMEAGDEASVTDSLDLADQGSKSQDLDEDDSQMLDEGEEGTEDREDGSEASEDLSMLRRMEEIAEHQNALDALRQHEDEGEDSGLGEGEGDYSVAEDESVDERSLADGESGLEAGSDEEDENEDSVAPNDEEEDGEGAVDEGEEMKSVLEEDASEAE